MNIVCFSGGHSSAIAAIETVRKYGKENVILLNHDISTKAEHDDIKRFKNEVANYLDVPITYANMKDWEHKHPLEVCIDIGAFQVVTGQALCTYNLKTKPFHNWLKINYPSKPFEIREDIKIIYGFDINETDRIQRRTGIMAIQGYITDYPLAMWDRTILDTEEIGIKKPLTYEMFRHANCTGCLKSGKQQWYIVFCLYPEIWNLAKRAEQEIGYSIIKDVYLEELENKFKLMRCRGIMPSEKINPAKFWALVNKEIPEQITFLPCECSI